MGDRRLLVGRPEGKRPLKDLGVDLKIVLEWIFKMGWGGMDGIDMAGVGACECGKLSICP
jgi:hypothetical protein